jgi:hypothetical protein
MMLMGPPQNQPTEAHKERIPRTRDAMARPLLSLAGTGVGTGTGTIGGTGADMGGIWSDIIFSFFA